MTQGRAIGQQFAVIPDIVLFAEISSNALRLWAIFQRHASESGEIYPGLKRLAKIMRCSTDTVSRAKRELVDAGLIECRERFDEHGRRTTDDVTLHVALVRGAHRKFAGYVPRKDAVTDPNKEDPNLPGSRSAVRRDPTDTAPIPSLTPATTDDRKQALRQIREIRGLYPPPDDDEEAG